MTKDEISKLPTPETDANTWVRAAPKQSSSRVEMVQAKLSRSLEQRLAAAVMVIDRAMRVSDLSLDKEAVETLAAIRGDK